MEWDIVFGLGVTVALPLLVFFYVVRRWFDIKERRIEIEASTAAERAAQYAVQNKELEQRVRVLEQIAVDGGAETAAQIEALRQLPERTETRN